MKSIFHGRRRILVNYLTGYISIALLSCVLVGALLTWYSANNLLGQLQQEINEKARNVLEDLDMVLIMTVNPGFGGQKYIPQMTEKIRVLRKKTQALDLPLRIEVDGGINDATIHTVLEAGADVIVAGSGVFRGDRAENVTRLLQVMNSYTW